MPIDSNAEEGPAFSIAIFCENGDAMHKSTGFLRPASSAYERKGYSYRSIHVMANLNFSGADLEFRKDVENNKSRNIIIYIIYISCHGTWGYMGDGMSHYMNMS